MKKIKVYWEETYSFMKEVEAENIEQAIDIVKSGEYESSEDFDGIYIHGSMQIDYDSTLAMNKDI